MKFDPSLISFGLPYEGKKSIGILNHEVKNPEEEFYNLDVYYDGNPIHVLQEPISVEDIADWAESQQENIGVWYDHFAAQLGLER